MEDATNVTVAATSQSSSGGVQTVPTVASSMNDTTPRAYSRNLLSGSIRGNQNVVGNLYVTSTSSNNQTIALSGITGQINIGANVGSTTTSEISNGIGIQGSTNSISLGISSTGINAELLFNDGTDNRLLIGQNTQGQEVVWITPPGVEVTTSTLAQRSFDSSASFTVLLNDSYTFASLGTVTTGTQAVSGTVPIAHNAGYYPFTQITAPFTVSGFTLPGLPTGFPQTSIYVSGSGPTAFIYNSSLSYFQVYYGVDKENLYLGIVFTNDEAGSEVAPALTIYYTVYALNAAA